MVLGPVLAETPLVLDTNILTAWRADSVLVTTAIVDYQSRSKLTPALTAISNHSPRSTLWCREHNCEGWQT